MEIVPFQKDRQDHKILCQLVYDTLPAFYELIPGNPEKKLAVIFEQLNASKTELSPAWVALVDGEVAGYVSYFMGDELPSRQFNGVTAALKILHQDERMAYLTALKKHTSTNPALPPNCLYIARLAVRPRYLPLKISADLMNFALDSFRDTARYACYIVHENIRSQKYTEKFGFRRAAESDDAMTYLYLKGVPN